MTPSYTVVHISPKTIELNKDPTTQWVLSFANQDEVTNNPFNNAPLGEQRTVTALLTRADGSEYYLENPASLIGWAVPDCNDVNSVEAPITPTPPKPYTPPSAPVPIDTSKEPYRLLTTLKYYNSPQNALEDIRAVSTLQPGKYYIYSTKLGMLNITKKPGTPGSWINPADNVETSHPAASAPEPAPPPAPYKPIFDPEKDWQAGYVAYDEPLRFTANGSSLKRQHTATVFNFVNPDKNTTITYSNTLHVWIAGRFLFDEILYGRPCNKNDDGSFSIHKDYGVAMSNLTLDQIELHPEDLEPVTIPDDVLPPTVNSRKLTALDRFIQMEAKTKKVINKTKRRIVQ